MLKVVKNSTAYKNCTDCFMVTNKVLSNRTLWELSIIGLVNFAAFLLLKILYNLVSMKYFQDTNNCWHKQSFKKCPAWPYLYFWCTFRFTHWFCLFFVFLALESVVSSTKTRFYRIQSSVTMRNYVETFHTNINHNLT